MTYYNIENDSLNRIFILLALNGQDIQFDSTHHMLGELININPFTINDIKILIPEIHSNWFQFQEFIETLYDCGFLPEILKLSFHSEILQQFILNPFNLSKSNQNDIIESLIESIKAVIMSKYNVSNEYFSDLNYETIIELIRLLYIEQEVHRSHIIGRNSINNGNLLISDLTTNGIIKLSNSISNHLKITIPLVLLSNIIPNTLKFKNLKVIFHFPCIAKSLSERFILATCAHYYYRMPRVM